MGYGPRVKRHASAIQADPRPRESAPHGQGLVAQPLRHLARRAEPRHRLLRAEGFSTDWAPVAAMGADAQADGAGPRRALDHAHRLTARGVRCLLFRDGAERAHWQESPNGLPTLTRYSTAVGRIR